MSNQSSLLPGTPGDRHSILERWGALDRGWKAALFGILIVLLHLSGVML